MLQLFGLRPDTPPSLLNLCRYRDSGSNPPREKLYEALRSAVKDFSNVYFVIDGIDECSDADPSDPDKESKDRLLEILLFFKTVREWRLSNLHLLLISRPEQDIKDKIETLLQAEGGNKINLSTANYSGHINEDIGIFIDSELREKKFGDLSADMKSLVKTTLISKADGMYAPLISLSALRNETNGQLC
jgi:hypothetical protein